MTDGNMSNWIENNVTTLEQSMALKDSGVMAGVDADGWWQNKKLVKQTGGLYKNGYGIVGEQFIKQLEQVDPAMYPAFRLDRLLSLLPEWCFTGCLPLGMSNDIRLIDIGTDVYYKAKKITVGADAIAACVDLLILLKEEGLLYE